MKGLKLNINICLATAILLGVIMALLNIHGSWSQHHLTAYDPFLYATLCCIAFSFLMASFAHAEKFKILTKVFGITYRLEHCFRLTAYFFAGVIVFGVNSALLIIENLHFIFTGLGILSGYIGLLLYSKTKKERLWSYIAVVIGIGGFIVGFVLKLYSTSWAEVIAAIPLAFWMYKSLNNKTC